MPTFVDTKFDALRTQGYTGTLSDMLLAWLEANTGLTGTINDLWDALCDAQGIAAGAIPDRKQALWESLGYASEFEFWAAGGTLVTLTCVYQLNDDGTVAASFGYLHLDTDAPDEQAFSKTQLSAETASVNTYIATADDPTGTDAITVGTDIVAWGAEITSHTGATGDIFTGANFFGVGAFWSAGAANFFAGHQLKGAADRELVYAPNATYTTSLTNADSGADLDTVTHKVVVYADGSTNKLGYMYYNHALGRWVDKGLDPAAGTFVDPISPYMFMDNDAVAVPALDGTTLTGRFRSDVDWLADCNHLHTLGAKTLCGEAVPLGSNPTLYLQDTFTAGAPTALNVYTGTEVDVSGTGYDTTLVGGGASWTVQSAADGYLDGTSVGTNYACVPVTVPADSTYIAEARASSAGLYAMFALRYTNTGNWFGVWNNTTTAFLEESVSGSRATRGSFAIGGNGDLWASDDRSTIQVGIARGAAQITYNSTVHASVNRVGPWKRTSTIEPRLNGFSIVLNSVDPADFTNLGV